MHRLLCLAFPKTLTVDLPADSPELQFGLHVYSGGTVSMGSLMYLNSISIQNEGTIAGAQDLVVGHNSSVVLRYSVR